MMIFKPQTTNQNGETVSPPNGWKRTRLGDVCEIVMGQSPEGTSYNKKAKGEPLLNGPTEFGPENPTAIQWTTEPTRFCQAGDVLLCVRGATTGRKNIADRRYCIGRGLAAIRGKPSVAETTFIWFALNLVTQKILSETAGSTFPTAAETVRVTTDAGPGYLKALGNRGGPHYLAADWLGTQLAAWLGCQHLSSPYRYNNWYRGCNLRLT